MAYSKGGLLLGSKDLAEKNLLQYKDVFSDIVNVNLFGGRHYISANELSREPGELITKSSSDNKLKQLQMDVPMKCIKKYNTRFFVCLENQSDINNIMPVRDMGYQHAKYMEQVRTIKETNRQQQTYPSPITKGIHDTQKLDPVITLVLNYSQKEWKKPKQLQDVLNIPKDIKNMLLKHIPDCRQSGARTVVLAPFFSVCSNCSPKMIKKSILSSLSYRFFEASLLVFLDSCRQR